MFRFVIAAVLVLIATEAHADWDPSWAYRTPASHMRQYPPNIQHLIREANRLDTLCFRSNVENKQVRGCAEASAISDRLQSMGWYWSPRPGAAVRFLVR
jgi:hypothetical protein